MKIITNIIFDILTELLESVIAWCNLYCFSKIDIGTIYHNPDHRFIRKYACVSHPDETLGTSGAGIKV